MESRSLPTKLKGLAAGAKVHPSTVGTALKSVAILGFASSVTLVDGYQVFCKFTKPNLSAWNATISAHSRIGQADKVFETYYKMQDHGIRPDKCTFLCILRVCGTVGALEQCRLIHDQLIRSALESDTGIGNTLLSTYTRCGSLEEALKVFGGLWNRDDVSWNVIISGYAEYGDGVAALELFQKMQREGFQPSKITCLNTLKSCGNMEAVTQGRLIHEHIIRSELDSDVAVGNVLVHFYGSCGFLNEADNVFMKIPNRDVVSWGAMISGYVEHGREAAALELFEKMQEEGIKPSKVAFLCILRGCSSIDAFVQGRSIHKQIIVRGLESDVVVASTLVNMYAKCGSLDEAHRVFDKLLNRNVVTWGAMISGYVQHGKSSLALELFEKMQVEGIVPSRVTLSCISKACCSLDAMGQGRLIHNQIIKRGFVSDIIIGTTIVDMYVKCGSLVDAIKVFDSLPKRNVVSWSAIIVGCVEHKKGSLAFDMFEKMKHEGKRPDKVIFLCILKACGSIAAISQGRMIHKQIIESGFEVDVAVGSALVDMYSKSGKPEEGHRVLDGLPNPNEVSWGGLIAGYAQQGNFSLVSQCLGNMVQQGVKPNAAIFSNVLVACSHTGLVEEGHRYFKSMRVDYDVAPSIEHYNCMVDLLGRAGCLHEAAMFLHTMPISPNIVVWTSLLASCRTYGNVELGKRCFDQAIKRNPKFASGYMLMSNLYGNAQLWEDVEKVQELRHCVYAQKQPGRAWIEVNKNLHGFILGGETHSPSDEIPDKAKRLSRLINKQGPLSKLDLIVEPAASLVDAYKETGFGENSGDLDILDENLSGSTETMNELLYIDCYNAKIDVLNNFES